MTYYHDDYEPKKGMSDFWGIFWMIIVGIILVNMAGCYSAGFNRGAKDYRKVHDSEKPMVYVESYPYGYMKGWEWQKLKSARDMKALKTKSDGIKTELTDKEWTK